jgi:uncharacterized protein (TIGR00255 family)
MIFSMTGFGRAIGQVKMLTLTVEIRTVNGKSLEYSNRLPAQYNDKEQEIRKRIADKLERGSIQLTIQRTDPSGNNFTINTQVLENYLQSLKPLAEKYQQDASVLLSQLIRLPEVLQNNQQQLDEEESVCLFETLDEALNQVLLFRKQEGLALQKDLESNLLQIQNILGEIEILAPQRYEKIKANLSKKVGELVDANQVDNNRFEQELIYYMEKLDINEEVIRLKNHLSYFQSQLISTANSAKGKSLHFMTQEIGREINTIGSKANDATMQQLVVKMKEELEKIKEQTMNVV